MKYLLGFISGLFAWILLVSATFVWGGYAIFQLIKYDTGFFEVVIPCFGGWLLQLFLGVCWLVLGEILTSK